MADMAGKRPLCALGPMMSALILRFIDSLCFVESSISHQGEGTKKTCFLTPLHSSASSVTFRGDKGLVFIFLQAN
jgi:hypothetical protein